MNEGRIVSRLFNAHTARCRGRTPLYEWEFAYDRVWLELWVALRYVCLCEWIWVSLWGCICIIWCIIYICVNPLEPDWDLHCCVTSSMIYGRNWLAAWLERVIYSRNWLVAWLERVIRLNSFSVYLFWALFCSDYENKSRPCLFYSEFIISFIYIYIILF